MWHLRNNHFVVSDFRAQSANGSVTKRCDINVVGAPGFDYRLGLTLAWCMIIPGHNRTIHTHAPSRDAEPKWTVVDPYYRESGVGTGGGGGTVFLVLGPRVVLGR